MPTEITSFNTLIAKPRVSSEHRIGMLKGHYPYLRSIRLRLTEDAESMTKIQHYLAISIILHNLLVGWDDNDWEVDEGSNDVSTASALDEENELNKHAVQGGSTSDTRRKQLYAYFCGWLM
jgi:hypothetical protein